MELLFTFLLALFHASCRAQKPLPICSANNGKNLSNRQLCKLTSNYPHFPIKIEPSFTINEVLELSSADRSMTISLYTVLKWNDTAAKVEGPNFRNFSTWFEVDGRQHSELFTPILSFINQRKNYRQQFYGDFSSMYQYFWHKPPHYFEYAEQITVTIGCKLTPKNFPFDSHTCQLVCYNPEKSTNTLSFLPTVIENKQGKGLMEMSIENHGLNFDIVVTSLPSGGVTEIHGFTHSTGGLIFQFKRNKFWTLITGYYLPTFLYSLLSGLSFTIQREQLAGRMGMMVTLSLISTNSYNAIEAPEDRGISFLEIWMLGTHFPILFAILEYGLVLAFEKSKRDVGNYRVWDKWGLAAFLSYQITFQFSYWLAASQYF